MENQDEGNLPTEFSENDEMEPTRSQEENPTINDDAENPEMSPLKKCPHCKREFRAKGLSNHKKNCSAKISTSNSAQKTPCRNCKKPFNVIGLPRHEKACLAKLNSPAKSSDVSTPIGRFCPYCAKDFRGFRSNRDKRRHMELCEKYNDYVEKEGDQFKCQFCDKIIDTHGRCLFHIEQKHGKKAPKAKAKKVSPPKKKYTRIRTVPQKPDDQSSQICKTCKSEVNGESLSNHENICSRYFKFCDVQMFFQKGAHGAPKKTPRFDCKLCKADDKDQGFNKTCLLYKHIRDEHPLVMYKTSNENRNKRKNNHQLCHHCQKTIPVQHHAKHVKLCSYVQDNKCSVCDKSFNTVDQARDHVQVVHQVDINSEAQVQVEEDPLQNVTVEDYDHETSMSTLEGDQTPKPRTPIDRRYMIFCQTKIDKCSNY